MFERQLTRIDTVRQYVDGMLKACEDSEEARCSMTMPPIKITQEKIMRSRGFKS